MAREENWWLFCILNQPLAYSRNFACPNQREVGHPIFMIQKSLLEELKKKRETARAGGGKDKLEARRKKRRDDCA